MEETFSGKDDYFMLLHVRLWNTQILIPQLCFLKGKKMLTDPCVYTASVSAFCLLCVYILQMYGVHSWWSTAYVFMSAQSWCGWWPAATIEVIRNWQDISMWIIG